MHNSMYNLLIQGYRGVVDCWWSYSVFVQCWPIVDLLTCWPNWTNTDRCWPHADRSCLSMDWSWSSADRSWSNDDGSMYVYSLVNLYPMWIKTVREDQDPKLESGRRRSALGKHLCIQGSHLESLKTSNYQRPRLRMLWPTRIESAGSVYHTRYAHH